jgi:hypothetical protein
MEAAWRSPSRTGRGSRRKCEASRRLRPTGTGTMARKHGDAWATSNCRKVTPQVGSAARRSSWWRPPSTGAATTLRPPLAEVADPVGDEGADPLVGRIPSQTDVVSSPSRVEYARYRRSRRLRSGGQQWTEREARETLAELQRALCHLGREVTKHSNESSKHDPNLQRTPDRFNLVRPGFMSDPEADASSNHLRADVAPRLCPRRCSHATVADLRLDSPR